MKNGLVGYSYNIQHGYKITCLTSADDTDLPFRLVTFGRSFKEKNINWSGVDKCFIIYSEKGLGRALIKDEWVELPAGSVAYWPSKHNVRYEPVGDEPWQLSFFTFTGQNAESMLGLDECALRSEELSFLPDFLDQLTEKHDKDDFFEFSTSGLCYLLLKLRKLTRGTANKERGVAIANRIYASIKRINDYVTEDLSVAALAEECRVSEEYYCRIFKQFTGTSPTKYINALRISRACDLLQKNPDSKIEEIGRECGFNHITYFNKIFKRETGLSPTEFKAKNKESASAK